MWVLFHDGIFTYDMFFKEDWKIIVLVLASVSFAKKSSETTDHLFIHYNIAQSLWKKVEASIGWKNSSQSCQSLCENLCSINTKSPKRYYIFQYECDYFMDNMAEEKQ